GGARPPAAGGPPRGGGGGPASRSPPARRRAGRAGSRTLRRTWLPVSPWCRTVSRTGRASPRQYRRAAGRQKGAPRAGSARPGRLALRLLANPLQILLRHRAQRRIASQEQDETARNGERQLLDPEAEVADEEGLGPAGLAAEEPDEDQLAHALARGGGCDEGAEGHHGRREEHLAGVHVARAEGHGIGEVHQRGRELAEDGEREGQQQVAATLRVGGDRIDHVA